MSKSKIKGLKRVNRIINGFLEQFAATAYLDDSFSCYMDEREITYPLLIEDPSDEYFIPFCKELAPDIEVDPFIISILHEVGHLYTRFNFSSSTWAESMLKKEKIQDTIFKNEDNDDVYEEMVIQYFNLPEEKAATEWALNYIRTHELEIEILWAELQPAIARFFRKNKMV